MTVNIDPSEVRTGTSAAPVAPPRLKLPLRTVLVTALGGTALIAFTVGAFSFFSTLADPRVRKPRPMPVAASMPDLKDGMPALVDGEAGAPAKAAFNLPRPITADPAAPEPQLVGQAAAAPPAAEPLPMERAATAEPPAPELRSGPTPPSIQNAATVPATRAAAIVAPPARPVATIAPARTETVKAKPVQASAVAAAPLAREPEPAAEPASTATVASPAVAQSPRKTTAAKPPAQKTASRKPSAKTVADAETDTAPAPAAASASAEESDIPGARQFRAGVKAISGIFGGESKDD